MFERLTSLINGANIAGATAAAKKSINEVAFEVLLGKWGSGETRKKKLTAAGYSYDKVQARVNEIIAMQNKILAWAKKTADSGKYIYVYWKDLYGSECAVCHPHNGKNKGWQCIGWTFACWFHGGLPTKCNCGVIDNGTWNKILKAKTDAEANKIAQNCVGSKDVVVIRNKGKAIPQSKLLPGDIFSLFDDNGYYHTCIYIGNGQLSDCTSSRTPNIKYGVNFGGKYASNCKVAIRYTGKPKAPTAPKKTVDQLAQEVIKGKWGSGDERKKKLTKAGYNYSAVQKRVNKILKKKKKK